jgi:hypothetical protein
VGEIGRWLEGEEIERGKYSERGRKREAQAERNERGKENAYCSYHLFSSVRFRTTVPVVSLDLD